MDNDILENLQGKRTGIALSGGGARGFAHLGVLKAMHELGIRPHVIAGVSAGSIVSVLYASGMAPDDIAAEFGKLSMSDITEIAIPKNGFFKLSKLKDFLKKHLQVTMLEELPLKTIVCATDFDRCTATAFETGPICDCVAASCSVPIVFQPVKINGTTYVDGGVMRNLPAWAIRDKCDFLIGVNVNPMPDAKYKNTLLDIASRTYDIMSRSNAFDDIALCDIVIQPHEIGDMSMFMFNIKPHKKIMESGYNEAMKTLSRLINP